VMATLPSFTKPPVDEVVLGVQFESPPTYRAVDLARVWELYRSEFPIIQEVPRLEPQFEIFGGDPSVGLRINFGASPLRARSWFVSSDGNKLIQFQDDRFLLNWRKHPNGRAAGQEYPRFEPIFASFSDCLARLEALFAAEFGEKLKVNQAEVSYINLVVFSEGLNEENTFKFFSPSPIKSEGYSATVTEQVLDPHTGQPIGRSYFELQGLVAQNSGTKAARLSITVRGKPHGDQLQDAYSFLHMGREIIVTRFCDLTTQLAHDKWGRTQ
jgi:uncharacterized protein (TIGR04255 family)